MTTKRVVGIGILLLLLLSLLAYLANWTFVALTFLLFFFFTLYWYLSWIYADWRYSRILSYRSRRLRTAATVLISLGLLATPVLWPAYVESVALPSDFGSANFGSVGGGSSGGGSTGNMRINGKIGMPALFLDSIRGGDASFDFFNLTVEDLSLKWLPVYMTQGGVYDAETGQLLFESSMFSGTGGSGGNGSGSGGGQEVNKTAPDFFPLWGVEKADYVLWDPILQKETTARYVGETKIHGLTVYKYRSELRDVVMDSMPGGLSGLSGMSGGGSGADMVFSSSDVSMIATSINDYWLHDETSIPLFLSFNMSFGAGMPDFTMLQVTEGERVTRSNGTIWVSNSTFPRLKTQMNVIQEDHRKAFLLPEDENIAVFESWTVYYDQDTGEPLPPEYQPDKSVFAVDRTTYRYVPYNGSERHGYYSIPIGNIEKKDYQIWDASIDGPNTLHFVREEYHRGILTWVYDLDQNNTRFDGPNPVVPIPVTPGTDYTYDGWTRYWYDPRSGFMIDMYMNGTIGIATSGPAGLVKVPVASFSFNFTDEMVEMMKLISGLYANLLIPMSNQNMYFFGMELHVLEPDTILSVLGPYIDYIVFYKYSVLYYLPFLLFATGAIGIYRVYRWKKKESEEGIPVVSFEAKYLERR